MEIAEGMAVAGQTGLPVRTRSTALKTRREHDEHDHQKRARRKYEDHREDVLEDPVPACSPLPFPQRHPAPGRAIAGRRIVQDKRLGPSATPPPRATDPDHHASRRLCRQCNAVRDGRKDHRLARLAVTAAQAGFCGVVAAYCPDSSGRSPGQRGSYHWRAARRRRPG
jgi:hypothetical protein